PSPRNPFVGSRPRSATGYVFGPDGVIAGFMPGCDAARLTALECTYQDVWSQIQPATENDNFVARYTQNLGPTWQFALQAAYFRRRSQAVYPAYGTFVGAFQGFTPGPGVIPTLLPPQPPTTIPATNPSYPAGTGLASGVLRYTFVDLGAVVSASD